jgi:hypothetical protein
MTSAKAEKRVAEKLGVSSLMTDRPKEYYVKFVFEPSGDSFPSISVLDVGFGYSPVETGGVVMPGSTRAAAALHVGRLSVALEAAERVLRSASAPVRFTQVIPDVKRVDLDYRTGDDRVIGNLLQLRSQRFPYVSRIFTEEDTA